MRNKLLTIMVLGAVLMLGSCDRRKVYSHYEHIESAEWEMTDTVRFNIPVRIYGTDNSCCSQYITRNITVIRSVKLCCTGDSELTANNSRVIALSAVVTEIDEPEITFTICLLFRSCLQQVVLREYTWEATPVCVSPNCAEARTLLTDNCDLTCGCVAGASCPSS